MSRTGAMFEELMKLCGLRVTFSDGTVKLAYVTSSQAQDSLKRLKELKELREGELARGAAVGALAGPLITGAGRLLSGAKSPKRAVRQLASDAFTGASFGGALPFVRNQLEQTVAKEKLRDYVAEGRSPTVRRRVKRSLGV